MSDTTTETPPAYKELHRSRDERMIAGVCGGLGRYFDLNAAFFRVGFVVLALLGGAGLLIYGAAILVIPDDGHRESIATEALRERRDRPWQLIGLGLVVVAGAILLSHATFWPDAGGAWLLLLVAGVLILWSQRRERGPATAPAPAETVEPGAPPPPAPVRPEPRPSMTLPALGVLIAGAGALGLLEAAGVDVPWTVALAVGAVATGVAVVVGAFLRMRVAGLVLVGVVLAFSAATAAAVDIRFEGGIGDRRYHPAATAELRPEYHLSIGDLRLDLSDAVDPGRTRVDASVGIGSLRVTVPEDTRVRVISHVGGGNAEILGRHFDGHGIDETVVDGSGVRTIVLDLDVGLGELTVERAVP